MRLFGGVGPCWAMWDRTTQDAARPDFHLHMRVQRAERVTASRTGRITSQAGPTLDLYSSEVVKH